jgi:hypothetical protein
MTLDQIKSAGYTEQMTNAVKYNEDVRKAWINIWVRNAARNYHYIEQMFEERSHDIDQLPKVAGGKPCLILGSGPSLDEAAPFLKDWEGDIFCSTSQLSLLEYLGVDPTYVVYIDADPTMGHLVTDHFRDGTEATLLTHPQMPLEILKTWGGDTYFFKMFDPGDEFSTKYLPPMYGGLNMEKKIFLGSYVLNSGCVANAMVALAQSLQYSPIFLCGYDLGYPNEVRRFTNYVKTDGEWVSNQEMLPPDRPVFKGNNGVTTDELSCFYKYSFMILYGLGNPPVISCSRGILSEIPHVPIEQVAEKQGKGFEDVLRTPIENYRRAREYLKRRGVMIVRAANRIETANLAEKGWFTRMKLRYSFWVADEFSRRIERGRPSRYRQFMNLITRGGPFEADSPGHRIGSDTPEQRSGSGDTPSGDRPAHGEEQGGAEAPAVQGHSAE